jgi:hypothetical protein
MLRSIRRMALRKPEIIALIVFGSISRAVESSAVHFMISPQAYDPLDSPSRGEQHMSALIAEPLPGRVRKCFGGNVLRHF